jgi:hypothetical protein
VGGYDFAFWAKGEEKDAELKGQERVAIPNRGRFRSARAKGEILDGRITGLISPRYPRFTVSGVLLCPRDTIVETGGEIGGSAKNAGSSFAGIPILPRPRLGGRRAGGWVSWGPLRRFFPLFPMDETNSPPVSMLGLGRLEMCKTLLV